MSRLRGMPGWSVLAVLLGFVAVLSLLSNGYAVDDQWFMLANGRYIVEHGFPMDNPFNAWGGHVVLENWLWSVLCWLFWSAFGGQGACGCWVCCRAA